MHISLNILELFYTLYTIIIIKFTNFTNERTWLSTVVNFNSLIRESGALIHMI